MSRAGVCATESVPGLSNLQPPTNLRPLVSREQSRAADNVGLSVREHWIWILGRGEHNIRRDQNIQSVNVRDLRLLQIFFCEANKMY